MKQEDEIRHEIRRCDWAVGWLIEKGLNEEARYLTAYGMGLRSATESDIESPVDVVCEQIDEIGNKRCDNIPDL